MATTVYTVDRAPLTALRERTILNKLFAENSIISGGSVRAGTGWQVDRLPGSYVVRGVLIVDDALSSNWLDLDVEEPDDSGDRLYVFWVKFNPLTDTTPTFGVATIPTDVATIADIFSDDDYLVIGIVEVPMGSSSAADGIYKRPDLRATPEDLRKMSMDQFVVHVDQAGLELSSAGSEGDGTLRLRWTQIRVVGERLEMSYNLTGSAIAVESPFGDDYTNQMEFPNWSYGFIFARVPRDVDGSYATPQSAPLRWVGIKASNGEIQDDQGSWFSTDDEYTPGDETHPARPQRYDVQIVAKVTPDGLHWANGMITKLGGHSSGQLGDAHNVLRLKSTLWATDASPEADGSIDLDNIITNAIQLRSMSIQTAYDGPTGSGSGRIALFEDGALELAGSIGTELDPSDPWHAVVRVTQAVGDGSDGATFSAALDVVDGFTDTEAERRHAIRHRRIWQAMPSELSAELTYSGSAVSITLLGGGVPVAADVLAAQHPIYATFVDLPGGTIGHRKVYKIAVVSGEIRVQTLDGVANIPGVAPDDFGAMLSTVSCRTVFWESTLELGGLDASMDSNLHIRRQLISDGYTSLAGDALEVDPASAVFNVPLQVLDTLDVTDDITANGNLEVLGSSALADTAVDGTLNVTGAATMDAVSCAGVQAAGVVYMDAGGVIPDRDGLSFNSSQILYRPFNLLAIGGWVEELSSLRYRAAAGGVVTCFFSLTTPPGPKLSSVKARFQKIAAAAYTATISVYKIKMGVAGNLTDIVSGSPIATGGATLSTLAPTDYELAIAGSVDLLEDEMLLVTVDGENVLLSPVILLKRAGTAIGFH